LRAPRRLGFGGVPGDAEFDEIERAYAGLVAATQVELANLAHPDEQGVPAFEEFPREIVERAVRDFVAAGAQTYLAVRDGAVAGGSSMRMTDGVAQLTGAATAPGSKSQQNVQRQGFALLYTRAVLIKDTE
jgi:hypothetical protein